MEQKTTQLRTLLNRAEPVVVAGAHNALSAKLVERAQFDAIWASSFEISATFGVPDASILTMAESLAVSKTMNDAVSIPVIADCDNGYGNAINVMRAVTEFEKAGIAGICIEDNIFPKRCSFYEGVRRELVSLEEHAGKIRAAKSAQKDPDFLVFARTEALIAGWGFEEALKRARAYAEAGADALVIHSKRSTPEEIEVFAKAWDLPVPLVAIPTTYKSTSVKDLGEMGFRMVIFANHALRASVKAMHETLQVLRQEGRAVAVDHRVASLSEVYELIGVSDLQQQEAQFLPPGTEPVKAIITAAGFEKELMPLIEEKPKSMLEIKGKTILERQMETLQSCQIRDVTVIRGYKKEKVVLPGARYYDNDRFQETYILSSLFLAEQELTGPCIFLYGDILFDVGIVEKLLKASGDIRIVMDRAWADHRPAHPSTGGRKTELVITDTPVSQNHHRFLPPPQPAQARRIGCRIDPGEAHGEFIGMAYCSSRGAHVLKEVYHDLQRNGRHGPFHEAASLAMASFADMLQELVDRDHPVHVVDIYKGWMEVDTFEDYQRVWGLVKEGHGA